MDPMDNMTTKACAEYEARLEDYVAGDAGVAVASEIAVHLKSCEGCRSAFEAAAASTRFLRVAMPLMDRAADPGPGFPRLVMARIRTEAVSAQKSIWRPVATFAWRFAMSATVALALLIAYASKRPADQVGTDVAQMRSGDLLYDPAAPPASRDDVLRMVADTDYGK
jgi:predicted anti-sigma-YlaC factor YlaD